MFFLKTSSRISKKATLDVIFCSFSAISGPKGSPRAPQIHQKSSKNGVQNSLGFPLAARSLPEGVQGSERYPKVIENRGFSHRFSLDVQWQFDLNMFFLAVAELCFDMYSCLLCSSAVHCIVDLIVDLSVFFLACELMLSSLSLCIPREWSLHCSALSGPFATTGATTGKVPAQRKAPYHFGVIFERRKTI